MPVQFQDISTAFEFANTNGDVGEFRAFVCKQTGKIYYQTDFIDAEELNDELPEDIDDEERYIPLPDKRKLDLGKPLVLAFAREFLPDDFDDVRYFFGKRGAYQKFKSLLARRGAIDRWHAYENEGDEAGLARVVRAPFDRNHRLIRRVRAQ
ncbi:hypothetical protein [Bradyrhizobium sp. 199]|uniref:hypothetical protein n=1 Tax=Bradyrhizobium sp. 199 TaxID=2782664 RepID=UPI001FF8ABA1|nr:hypothetical protein [Bradyrhizobium sp. 199]